MFGRLKTASLALLVGLVPSASFATGGVWCDATDDNLDFHFQASQARDGTGGWWGIEGKLVTKFGKLPAHLVSFEIKDANLTQRWLGRDNVMLEIQAYDSEPFASVMLTVETKANEDSYEGTYALRISDTESEEAYVTRTGPITCGAE